MLQFDRIFIHTNLVVALLVALILFVGGVDLGNGNPVSRLFNYSCKVYLYHDAAIVPFSSVFKSLCTKSISFSSSNDFFA